MTAWLSVALSPHLRPMLLQCLDELPFVNFPSCFLIARMSTCLIGSGIAGGISFMVITPSWFASRRANNASGSGPFGPLPVLCRRVVRQRDDRQGRQ